MKKIVTSFLLLFVIQAVSYGFTEKIGFGLGLGSGGYELKGIYRFNDYFSSSVEYNAMGLDNISLDDVGAEGQDISASGSFQISSIKGLVHFHPFASGFRVSGGYAYNLSDISIDFEGTNVDIGEGNTADISGSITIDTGDILPYIGAAWGYNYEDFVSFDLGLGVLFLPKITGEDFLDSDLTISSSVLNSFITAVDDDVAADLSDLATDYPDVYAAIQAGDPFELYDALDAAGIVDQNSAAFDGVPNKDSYIGEIQDQIDTIVEATGLGVIQDALGYAPLPVFSVGFSIFFR